jgi:predicted Zn-dependent protease
VIVVEAPSVTISPPLSVYQVFDYSQPVSVVTAEQEKEADDDVTKYAMGRFDDAREAFKRGLHSTALTRIEQAIKLLPSDTTMHEFRALILFAQNKYKDSAAGLYSVLATGPGMDWNTMSRLYPDQETYEKQLRLWKRTSRRIPRTAKVTSRWPITISFWASRRGSR